MNFIDFFRKDWQDGEIIFMGYVASSFSEVGSILLRSSDFISVAIIIAENK